jgi:hypothetical protein
MSEVRVFLGGEGRNELGSWAGHPAYQNDAEPGVIKALLVRTQPQGWKVIGALSWKRCRKYTDFGPLPATLRRNVRHDHEKSAVLGLVLDAKEHGAQAVAFVRDEDDDPERGKVIADAINLAQTHWPHIRIAGGTAVPVLEGWILALMGDTGTESLGKVKAQRLLADRNVTSTSEMVREVLADRLVPEDAAHLRSWLAQARDALG